MFAGGPAPASRLPQSRLTLPRDGSQGLAVPQGQGEGHSQEPADRQVQKAVPFEH